MVKPRKQPIPDLNEIVPILIGQWRRMMEMPGPPDILQTREFRSVVDKVRAIQSGIIDGDALAHEDYFADKATLGAYTLYQWILHYQEGLSLINEIPEPPLRVLDLCAGPCPFAFAALRHGAHEVIAFDKNMEALRWGAQICGRYGMPLTILQGDCKQPMRKIEGKFDLIILGYALKELFPNLDTNQAAFDEAAAYLKRLGKMLNPEGHLLIVESSLGDSNRTVLRLRDALVEEKMAVQAPCVFRGPCPALQRKDTPCYAQRDMEKPYFVSEIQRAAGIHLGSLKMSYVIFRAPGAAWPETGERALYRVISPPFESHYGTSHYLCGVDGKKKISGEENKINNNSKAFLHLKRGELIQIEKPIERGNIIELGEETAVKVVAAPGKAFIPN